MPLRDCDRAPETRPLSKTVRLDPPALYQIPGTPAGLGDTVDLTHTPGGHRTLGKIDTKGTYDYFAASTDASGSTRHAHHFLDPSPRGVSPNMNGNGGTGGANLAAPPISSINQRRGNPSAKLGLSLQHAGAGPSTTTPSPMASPRVTGYGKPPSQSSFPIAHHASRSPSSPAPPKRTASDAQVISRNSINPRKAVAQSFGSGGGVTMMRSTSSALDTEESETYNPAAAGAGPLPSDSGVALGVVVQPSVSASLTRRVGAAEVKAKDD
ncbi:hypothetical protein QFC19_006290 [Naganishia cerealis]|uniref:Uncharacterized protein n=1 Tax=Naganishia cerealis TaxID=610337 RepID=A0ACC2VHG6_9TREE|nr:hypothetical protein QFC19_006290 [Naganishia cerealis]